MATILIKKKDTSGAPGAGDLTNSTGGAEIAVNTADKRLYTKTSGGSVVELGTNPATLQVNSAFTFPTSDGTNGQVLSTNGSGTVTWSNAATGDVTTTGTQTLTNKTLTDPAIIGAIKEDVYTITDGAAFEIDPGNGSVQLITLGASRTPKATNFTAGESVMLMVDDGTAYTLTWTDSTFGGSGVVWKTDGGVAPTLNTTGYTVIVLWKVSTQVYGARVGDA
jgi:hypothetical protein